MLGSKQARQSRSIKASNVREARCFDKPTGAELEELVQTSKLVPKVDMKTDTHVQMQPITPATTAPSSATTSPLLECIIDDTAVDAWPSLREAVNGWDFCSDSSDPEDMWENLPEPAIDLDDYYVDLLEGAHTEKAVIAASLEDPGHSGEEEQEKATLADLLRGKQDADEISVQPPVLGARMPPSEHRMRGRQIQASTEQVDLYCNSSDERQHG
jgi:hypothetical protein